jgi:excisionase family DNA binding protein
MSTVSIEITGKYYSCPEAAELLDLDADTVRRYCNSLPPRLRAQKVGRDWFIPKAEIDRYKKERRDPGRPPEK